MEQQEQEQEQDNLTCVYCGEQFFDDSPKLLEDCITCDDCWEGRTDCDDCSLTCHPDNLTYLRDYQVNVCNPCFDKNYFQCDWCGDDTRKEESYECDNSDICESCYENRTWWCEGCENNHHMDYSCNNCGIHEYSYRPCMIYRYLDSTDKIVSLACEPSYDKKSDTRHMFMGFEVEVEAYSAETGDGASCFKNEELMYLKHDGSLNCGFEVVSHPTTMASYHKMSRLFFEPFDKLSRLGFRAWRTDTCGMHVHLSRKGFDNKSHLWRFAFFINSNPRQMQMMAGRTSQRWATFDNQREEASKIIAGKAKYASERYVAVNLSNRETVEIRIFRSSLLPRRILANLGLCDLIVKFTRNLTVKDINEHKDSWGDFVRFVMSQDEPMYESTKFYVGKYFGESAPLFTLLNADNE